MYPVNTNWQVIVPKLNSKGRDLLVVSAFCSSLNGKIHTALCRHKLEKLQENNIAF